MTRKYSEAKVREALGAMDLDLIVFKPQDFKGPTQNTKPADFLVWIRRDGEDARWGAASAMIEVKETDAKTTMPVTSPFIRQGQVAAMRDAQRIGLPYYVVVRWSTLRRWTITTGPRVLHRIDEGVAYKRFDMPIDCPPGDLAPHLRMALLGEIDDD